MTLEKNKNLISNCTNLPALFFACLTLPALAGQPYIMNGSATTLGPSSSENTLHTGIFNPAMGALMINEKEKWRVGYLPSIATEFEIGDVANFSNDLDDLIDLLDDETPNTESTQTTLDRFNAILPKMGKDGYLKNTSNIDLPLFFRGDIFGGTLNANFNYSVQVAGHILDDILLLNSATSLPTTNTSVYLKSGQETNLSLAYSYPLLGDDSSISKYGNLFVGARLSAIRMELAKQVIWLEGVKNKTLSDVIRDEYDKNLTSKSGMNLDLGMVWSAERYRVGFTLSHLNKPSFAYNTLGVNCDAPENTKIENDNCHIANFFIAEKKRLKGKEVHEMKPLGTVDATLKITGKWHLTGSMDLAAYDDIVGFENKMMRIATSYNADSFWLPSPRLGYSKNLAGAKLSTLNAGLTFFHCISLDIQYGQESTIIDDEKLPRKAGFSLGFEEKF